MEIHNELRISGVLGSRFHFLYSGLSFGGVNATGEVAQLLLATSHVRLHLN